MKYKITQMIIIYPKILTKSNCLETLTVRSDCLQISNNGFESMQAYSFQQFYVQLKQVQFKQVA